MTRLDVECTSEKHMARALRQAAVEVIERRGTEEAAKVLDLAPIGVKTLLWTETWSVTTALRVAEILELNPVSVIQQHMGFDQPVRHNHVGSSP